MKLSQAQQMAVNHREGPALCIAGPGSGKTAVIVRRVQKLIEEGVKPEDTVVVTFAKAAAKSMERRFINETGISGARFSTIHSLCYTIINRIGNNENRLIPENVKRAFLLKMLSLHDEKFRAASQKNYLELSMEISRFKSGIFSGNNSRAYVDKAYVTHFVSEDIFRKIIPKYYDFLRENSYYDFDDMTGLALDMINAQSERVKKFLHCRYLLADEFQDTSPAQLNVLEAVAGNNIFAVGDDDQSIYSFRGASPAILEKFAHIHKDLEIFYLTDNYRCNNTITNAANAVIKENKERFEKSIVSKRETELLADALSLHVFKTQHEELKGVCSHLAKKSKTGAKTLALLTRTNYEAQTACCMLERAGVSCRGNFTKSSVFDDIYASLVLSFMKFSENSFEPSDFVNVLKIAVESLPVNVAFSCCGKDKDDTFERLFKYAEYDKALYEEIRILKEKIKIFSEMNPFLQIMFLRNAMGLDRYFRSRANAGGAEYEIYEERINVFAGFAKDFSTTGSMLEYARRISGEDTFARDSEAQGEESVRVMTLHAAKGLEFDEVWILNANEGIIPFRKAVDKGMIEEERRLFYVGMTRARDSLNICTHKSSGGKASRMSPFLKGIVGLCKVVEV